MANGIGKYLNVIVYEVHLYRCPGGECSAAAVCTKLVSSPEQNAWTGDPVYLVNEDEY